MNCQWSQIYGLQNKLAHIASPEFSAKGAWVVSIMPSVSTASSPKKSRSRSFDPACLSAAAERQFTAERQILANLEHPNIARLLDGGSAEDLPYVVMEYIDGIPLDAHLEQAEVPLEHLLSLFIRLCDAVQTAHRSLIIHRDIKPSNVLVDSQGEPKLLDFGIAKSLDLDAADTALLLTAAPALTPAYASPEQIRGEALTTATDVYSLGVAALSLLERAATTQPRRSETQLNANVWSPRACRNVWGTLRLSNNRSTRSHQISKPSWHKALAQEPGRRYDSAGALGNDLQAFLGGYAVSAQPDGWAYRSKTFHRP